MKRYDLLPIFICLILGFCLPAKAYENPMAERIRYRARHLGIEIGIYNTGPNNAITDVPGVLVGGKTLWLDPPAVKDKGKRVRSGVTAILPHSRNLYLEKIPCGFYCANAFGKVTGYTQIKELGNLETPILITDTLNVPKVADALTTYMLSQPEMKHVGSINPLVGETNSGKLNDRRARPLGKSDVYEAILNAKNGYVPEGSIWSGTPTHCMGWKGGIGTSSRVLPENKGGYSIGVLVQTNFGGNLTISGAPVGRELGKFSFQNDFPKEDGSCMVIVATNAPLCSRNLERLAKRAMYGIIRTGSYSSNGSGDYVIAFSTAYTMPFKKPVQFLNNSEMSRLFVAVEEATEESVLNSLFMATTVSGKDDHQLNAIPLDKVIQICERHDVLFLHSKLAPFAPTKKASMLKEENRRLSELDYYISKAKISEALKKKLKRDIEAIGAKNKKAAKYANSSNTTQFDELLFECHSLYKTLKDHIEEENIKEPYRSMFISRANLAQWLLNRAIDL